MTFFVLEGIYGALLATKVASINFNNISRRNHDISLNLHLQVPARAPENF